MKKLILISSMLLVSAQTMASHIPASARFITNTGSIVLKSEMVDSKEDAVNEGHEIMYEMENKNLVELSRMLLIPSSKLDVRSLKVDDSFITVQRLESHSGDVKYQANVKVKYHYNERENND
jgi:hypothetical protein